MSPEAVQDRREYKRAYYLANKDMSPEAVQRKRERRRAYYAANRERELKLRRAYYYTNHEHALANGKAYYAANRERVNAAARKRAKKEKTPEQRATQKVRARERLYRLAPGEFDTMLAAQTGLCAICKKHMEDPHVDHDHATARVRALLCRQCNAGLGQFEDSMSRLFAASEYLRYWKIRYEN